MELKLYIKQQLTVNTYQQQVYYDGQNPQSLKPVETSKTPLPASRSFPEYPDFLDMTDNVSDLYKLKLTWTQERDEGGLVSVGASQQKKSASGTLIFEGEAYRLLKKWLVDDVSAPLNSVAVKIEHVGCGSYLEYAIKAADLSWCESAECTFDITLKQQEEMLNCIKSTWIGDNHQGWFQTTPAGSKRHPRFSYCNEARPNGMMVMVWWLIGNITVPALTILIPILFSINGILFVVNLIIDIINGLKKLFGGKKADNVPWKKVPYFDLQAMLDALSNFYIESAGCGREHPAPLVRDYISNVCTKCGVTVDQDSAPIFFNPVLTIETSSRTIEQLSNPHYNACYFFPQAEKGVRRFKSLNMLRAIPNNTDFYLVENTPLYTLDMFLDELKVLYNAEWRLRNNILYFQRKDWFEKNNSIYNFSEGHPDRMKLVEGICYEWNEEKYPAYTSGLYSQDAADTAGNNAMSYMNDYVSHGNAIENPNFEGVREILTPFTATKFRLDGNAGDYLYDAFQVVVNGSFLTPFLAGIMFDIVAGHIEQYADYALLLSDENTTAPKILLWDGERYENARCIKPYYTSPKVGNTPPANPTYNPNSDPWDKTHRLDTTVRGANLTLPPSQEGYFLVTDFFGAREIKKPAMLTNYNMYFAPGYKGGLWDWFHWIDDPRVNPMINMKWTAKIELCCEDLLEKDSNNVDRLGVFGDASNILLGEKVTLPLNYYTDGRITEIEVNYDPTNVLGQHIVLKGKV